MILTVQERLFCYGAHNTTMILQIRVEEEKIEEAKTGAVSNACD